MHQNENNIEKKATKIASLNKQTVPLKKDVVAAQANSRQLQHTMCHQDQLIERAHLAKAVALIEVANEKLKTKKPQSKKSTIEEVSVKLNSTTGDLQEQLHAAEEKKNAFAAENTSIEKQHKKTLKTKEVCAMVAANLPQKHCKEKSSRRISTNSEMEHLLEESKTSCNNNEQLKKQMDQSNKKPKISIRCDGKLQMEMEELKQKWINAWRNETKRN